MKLNYVGIREDEFGSGRCPSGDRYAVIPGKVLDVPDGDGAFLLATYPELYEEVVTVKPKKQEVKDDHSAGL